MAHKKARKPKVLIVDDEAAILHALGMYLKQEGYSTEAIAKFDHYLANMESSKLPDVVVLDILLNQEDGLKIAREIKDDPKTSHIPIILISALPNVDKLAKDVEADAFMAKPFDMKKLNATVEKVLKAAA
jgi:two-component system alkaline phosphatase synthesis response regulator PhoP